MGNKILEIIGEIKNGTPAKEIKIVEVFNKRK